MHLHTSTLPLEENHKQKELNKNKNNLEQSSPIIGTPHTIKKRNVNFSKNLNYPNPSLVCQNKHCLEQFFFSLISLLMINMAPFCKLPRAASFYGKCFNLILKWCQIWCAADIIVTKSLDFSFCCFYFVNLCTLNQWPTHRERETEW